KCAVGLRRIAIDKRPQKHRVGGAADLVFDGEQMPSVRKVDDIAKAILVSVVFAEDEIAFGERAMRAREIRDVDLDVMAVVFWLRPVGLAKHQALILSDFHGSSDVGAILDLRRNAHDLRVEFAITLGATDGSVEFDIGNAERDTPETGGVRLVATQAVAPG